MMHVSQYLFIAFFFLTSSFTVRGQSVDPLQSTPFDSLSSDSAGVVDSVQTDSLVSRERLEQKLGIRISSDALTSPVRATATDSAVLLLKQNEFFLYGDAHVRYEDLELEAGEIEFDQRTQVLTARPILDSLGSAAQNPSFTQGGETVTYDSLRYNFQSKRAIILNARTQYGEGFVFSEQVKRNPDQSIYGWKNIYTTCALPTPHFGIRAQKIKVIPNRVIASASANIMVEQVPTPIFLPFGLFPVTQQQKSGFQLPTYTIEGERGLGLTDGGYYFRFNDYFDFLFMANLYSKGSYSLSGVSSYSNRYQYNGGVSLSYAFNKTGENYEPGATIQRDFMFNWRHQSDPKARPGSNFSASVTVGTSSFYSNNSYNVNQILNNQYTSNISYSKVWQDRPFSLSVAARHNQNTQTGQVTVYLPELNFYVSQFSPFQRKNGIGSPKWYEKITASYNVNMVNQTVFLDTSFSFGTFGLNDFRNGLKHSVPISAAYQMFRFVNVSFGINYTEYWLTEHMHREYNPGIGGIDTVSDRGFYTARDFSTSVNMSTRIYGLKMFPKGKIMGIRHVISPHVGFHYTPDYAVSPFNYYYKTRLDTGATEIYLSPYEGSVIGVPGLGQYGNFSSSVSFGVDNNLQIKVRSRQDTTNRGRNVTLIDALSLNTAYNIAADSFNWSNLSMGFRTNILDRVNISANALFDPYAFDYEDGRRLPVTMWQLGQGIARFRNASVALSANFRSGMKKDRDQDPATQTEDYRQLMRQGGYNDYVDFNIPWSFNLAYALSIDNRYLGHSKKDSLFYTQNVLVSGDFNLTERWKITFSSGYDFTNKTVTLTSIDIYRDLHCWEMRMGMIPFGDRKSFNFTLNVKASILQDLKLVRRRDYRDVVH